MWLGLGTETSSLVLAPCIAFTNPVLVKQLGKRWPSPTGTGPSSAASEWGRGGQRQAQRSHLSLERKRGAACRPWLLTHGPWPVGAGLLTRFDHCPSSGRTNGGKEGESFLSNTTNLVEESLLSYEAGTWGKEENVSSMICGVMTQKEQF